MNIMERRVGLANRFLESRIIRRTFPEIGRIKIGERRTIRKGDKVIQIPTRFDHFVITRNVKNQEGNFVPDIELMERIASMTGQSPDKLTQIPVIFPFELPELNFQIWFVCYRDGKLFCRGDGNTAIRRTDEGNQEYVNCPCERYNYPENHQERCRLYGRLHCFIKGARQFGGVWVFRTRSVRTIETLWRQMKQFHAITGGLSGFVFLLNLNQEKVMIPRDGDYETRTIYTVSLLYDPEYDDVSDSPLGRLIEKSKMLREKKKLKLLEERRMLEWITTSVAEEEESLEKEIQEEFYPDPEVQAIVAEAEIEDEPLTEREFNELTEPDLKEEIPVISVERITEKTEKAETTRETLQVKQETETRKVEKTERQEARTTDGKPAYPSQIKIIKENLGKYMIAKGISREEVDGYLELADTLSYDEALPIVRALVNKKIDEAYSLFMEVIRERLPEKSTSTDFDLEDILDDSIIEELDGDIEDMDLN